MILSWMQLALGLWLIASPWFLGYSSITVMKWGNTVAGIVLVIVNVWVIFGAKVEKPTNA